jgi:hypothetical protein
MAKNKGQYTGSGEDITNKSLNSSSTDFNYDLCMAYWRNYRKSKELPGISTLESWSNME